MEKSSSRICKTTCQAKHPREIAGLVRWSSPNNLVAGENFAMLCNFFCKLTVDG